MCYNFAAESFLSKKLCKQADGQTDGHNYDSQDRTSIAASRGKNVVKQAFEKFGKMVSCTKMGGSILTIYTSYDVFCARSDCLLGVEMIAPALKILVALI